MRAKVGPIETQPWLVQQFLREDLNNGKETKPETDQTSERNGSKQAASAAAPTKPKEIDVKRLHPEAVLKFWPHIEPELEKALEHGAGETPVFKWFKNLVNDPDNYHLWLVTDDGKPVNLTLTKWNYYDTHIALHLVLTTSLGDSRWKDYKEAHHILEDFAKHHNARRIEQWGRDGWSRIIPKLSGANGEKYKQTYIVMSMELDYEDEECTYFYQY